MNDSETNFGANVEIVVTTFPQVNLPQSIQIKSGGSGFCNSLPDVINKMVLHLIMHQEYVYCIYLVYSLVTV